MAMQAIPQSVERRVKRSGDPLVALHYQLAQARQRDGLDAIVVADQAGIVVAGAGSWPTCEELAAYAPLLAQGGWTEPGLPCPSTDTTSRLVELRAEVDLKAVDLQGQTVLLCARGGPPSAGAMDRAAQGVARILHSA